jgi:hypothetical protein
MYRFCCLTVFSVKCPVFLILKFRNDCLNLFRIVSCLTTLCQIVRLYSVDSVRDGGRRVCGMSKDTVPLIAFWNRETYKMSVTLSYQHLNFERKSLQYNSLQLLVMLHCASYCMHALVQRMQKRIYEGRVLTSHFC